MTDTGRDPDADGAPLTLVVPCYNEASRLPRETFRTFAESTPDVSFLFVNDGSSDTTSDVLKDFCAERPEQFVLLDLPKNKGKGEAVRAGMNDAIAGGAKLVGFWDADLAIPLEDALAMREILRQKPHLEAVFGSKINLLGRSVQRSVLRHLISRAFATLISMALDLPIYDSQCGAKLFRATDDLRAALTDPFASRWLFDVELLGRLIQIQCDAGRPTVDTTTWEHPVSRCITDDESRVTVGGGLQAVLDLWPIYRRCRPYRGRTRRD